MLSSRIRNLRKARLQTPAEHPAHSKADAATDTPAEHPAHSKADAAVKPMEAETAREAKAHMAAAYQAVSPRLTQGDF